MRKPGEFTRLSKIRTIKFHADIKPESTATGVGRHTVFVVSTAVLLSSTLRISALMSGFVVAEIVASRTSGCPRSAAIQFFVNILLVIWIFADVLAFVLPSIMRALRASCQASVLPTLTRSVDAWNPCLRRSLMVIKICHWDAIVRDQITVINHWLSPVLLSS